MLGIGLMGIVGGHSSTDSRTAISSSIISIDSGIIESIIVINPLVCMRLFFVTGSFQLPMWVVDVQSRLAAKN